MSSEIRLLIDIDAGSMTHRNVI